MEKGKGLMPTATTDKSQNPTLSRSNTESSERFRKSPSLHADAIRLNQDLTFGARMKKTLLMFASIILVSGVLLGCATETSQTITPQKVNSANSVYNGPRIGLVVGKFDNRSSFMRGLFSDGVDRLGSQAKTILIGHLQQANRFNVMDRENLQETKFEANLNQKELKIQGAQFVVTGDVTEFGRKETGDHQLFGILGRGKTQIAYSKVTLNVVDTQTSQVVHSVQGAGEYALSNREIIGFGGTASYDSTLNGKVLDLAIREAVNRLTEIVDGGNLKSKN